MALISVLLRILASKFHSIPIIILSCFQVGLVYTYISECLPWFSLLFSSPVMNSYGVLDTLHVLFHLIFTIWYHIDAIIIPNVQMKELKLRKKII